MEELDKLSDEELEDIFVDTTVTINTIKKSEKIAKKILAKYHQDFFDYHRNNKEAYNILCEYVKKRNVFVPVNLFSVEITLDDVIERLRENEACNVTLINKYAKVYYGYLGNGNYVNNKENVCDKDAGVRIRIEEINALYEKMIEEASNMDVLKNKLYRK